MVVPEEYWAQHPPTRINPPYVSAEPQPTGARPPAPMDYVFAFDVSETSIQTGFLLDACTSLIHMLYGRPLDDGTMLEPYFPPTSRVCIITFNSSIQFYDLSSKSASMLVVGDLEEVFTPIRKGLFVNPAEAEDVIKPLLESIPRRHSEFPEYSGAFIPAVRAGLAAFAGHGGHLIVFQSTLPSIGPGALPAAPQEDTLYGTAEEMSLHKPRDKLYLDVAEECIDDGVGVTLFLAPNQYMDIGSVGALANVTGGDIYFHPRYEGERDRDVMDSQIRRTIGRFQGFNVVARVRVSNGMLWNLPVCSR